MLGRAPRRLLSLAANSGARRIIRFSDARGDVHLALQAVEGGEASLLTGDLFQPASLREIGKAVDLDSTCSLMAPIDPPIILATGLNFHHHAAECGLPVPKSPILAFLKQPTAVQHPGLPIVIPAVCDPDTPEVDWEVELAVVIGSHCKDATVENALDYVLGYTCANDISARRWQLDVERTSGQWNRGKGFDTFLPLGPALVLNEQGFDPHALRLSLTVNVRPRGAPLLQYKCPTVPPPTPSPAPAPAPTPKSPMASMHSRLYLWLTGHCRLRLLSARVN